MNRAGEPDVAVLMAQLAANAAEIAALKAEKEALSRRVVKLEPEQTTPADDHAGSAATIILRLSWSSAMLSSGPEEMLKKRTCKGFRAVRSA